MWPDVEAPGPFTENQAMSSHQTAPISEVPVLRNGRFEPSTASRFGQVYNPSSGRVIARVPLCSAEQNGQVVEAAAAEHHHRSADAAAKPRHRAARWRQKLPEDGQTATWRPSGTASSPRVRRNAAGPRTRVLAACATGVD